MADQYLVMGSDLTGAGLRVRLVELADGSFGVAVPGPRSLTILANASRTATVDSPDQQNLCWRGLHVVIVVAGVTDTPSIVVKIQGKHAGGGYYDLLASAAITAAGTYILKVMPWAANVANVSAADLLPATWRVRVEHGDADAIEYAVYAALGA